MPEPLSDEHWNESFCEHRTSFGLRPFLLSFYSKFICKFNQCLLATILRFRLSFANLIEVNLQYLISSLQFISIYLRFKISWLVRTSFWNFSTSCISNLPFRRCLISQLIPANPSGHKHWKVFGVKLRQVALLAQGLDEQLFYKES